MSDPQAVIAATIRAHFARVANPDPRQLAAEIDKALGGLKRETANLPVWTPTGEMDYRMVVPIPMSTLAFVPSQRYITPYTPADPEGNQ